jgi:hypothetical protein
MDSKVCQYLAINIHASLVQASDQLTVRRATETSSRVDTNNPETPEIAFAIASVTVSVRERLHASLIGSPIQQVFASSLTLGELEYFLVPLVGRHTPLYSRQYKNPL